MTMFEFCLFTGSLALWSVALVRLVADEIKCRKEFEADIAEILKGPK